MQLGNEIHFPAEEMRLCAIYNKEDRQSKHYRIYDNIRNQFIRRLEKKSQNDEAMAMSANVLAFVDGEDISLRSIRMPRNATLIDILRPRIAIAESKRNPA